MDVSAPFLAGFVAGEAHFFIRPNNAGQSWCCGFQLCQRDDNADLVAAVRDLAGCGEIRWIAPHGTSNPQVLWQVQTIDDCTALASLLARVHLLGKKAGELGIWRRAVATWKDLGSSPSRWKDLERLAYTLRAHRRAGFVADYTRVDISSANLANFLTGFASAEGHFGASSSGHPRFTIKLRGDDSAVLAFLSARFGVGRLVSTPRSLHGQAQMAWLVTRLDDLRALVPVFDGHPPLGRAGRIYLHWRELVLARDRRATTLQPLAEQIRTTRCYRPPSELPARTSGREAKSQRYVAALQEWTRDTGPPHTATSYQRWREGEGGRGPTRNTLASFFGSWRAALIAAGISTDDSRPAETIERCLESAASIRAGTASRRRLEILQAVDRCWAALGRVPDASEFFRWRLRNAAESPSQADLYRLFPGGWPTVLDALPPRGLVNAQAC